MFEQLIPSIVQGLVILIGCAFALVVGKVALDLVTAGTYNADQAIDGGNNAVAIRRFGFYLAVAVGLVGSINSTSPAGIVADTFAVGIDAALIISYLIVALFINNALVVTGVNNTEELKSGNTAVGIVEAGAFIGTGLIAMGSVSGSGGPWWASVVYFGLGQVILLSVVRLYQFVTSYDVISEIKNGNSAVAVTVAGMLVSVGFVLQAAISGPFTGWSADLMAFSVSVVSGIVFLLFVANHFVDKVFLPNTTIDKELVEEKNVAAAFVVSGVRIALALAVGSVVL